MAFVRLAGCSVGCAMCDTDYRVDRRLSIESIVDELRAVIPPAFTWSWVWITGGEPTDHDLEPLVSLLRTLGFRVALATSGVHRLDRSLIQMLHWLSVSPHAPTFEQTEGHELKIVPGLGALSWTQFQTAFRTWNFPWKFLQPIDWRTPNGPEHDGAESQKSLIACRDFVLRHPGWQLTLQAHKLWGLP